MKAPSRIQVFKSLVQELLIPPKPITTRWETWIKSAKYCATIFENILRVFDALQGKKATAIKISKDLHY